MLLKNTIIILLLAASALHLNAQTFTQEVYSSGGGYYKQINGSMQFNIGEPLTESYSASDGILYQGFEQGSYSILSVYEIGADAITANVFPNPAIDFLNVSLASNSNATFDIKIYSMMGQTLSAFTAHSNEIQKIDLLGFTSSIFYITISNSTNGYKKTFKITKVK